MRSRAVLTIRSTLVLLTLGPTLLMAATGCASKPSRFYTLSATPAPGAAPMPSELSVALSPVLVPTAVDRPQMVVAVGPNEVRLDEFHRWDGPLANTIARVVAENLVAQLGTPRVAISAQTLGTAPDYRVAIEVQRFDSALGEAATLDAVWAVGRAKDGASRTGRTNAREPTADKSYEALAGAHSRALARLSQDIAEAVRTLERAGR